MPSEIDVARTEPGVVDRCRQLPVAALADALGRTGVMTSSLRLLVPGSRLAGPALTVRCYPGDNLMVHYGVAIAQPGDVLIVDGAGYTEGALWGGLLGRSARQRRLAGAVIDGAARDVEELRELGLPLYARAVTPRGVFKTLPGVAGVPVSCGGVVVHPGDLIVGDSSGVVVLPRAQAVEVVAQAERLVAREAELAVEIERGRTLYEVLGLEQRLRP